jgi:hypothetical protein
VKQLFIVTRAITVMIGCMLCMRNAVAHHSFAMFDNANVVTLKATVKDFQWTNPHVILWVYAQAKDKEPADLWTVELTSPGNLTRSGWSRHSLKVGDKLELLVNPLRDGSHGGSFKQATILETGQVLVQPNLGAQEKPGLQ